jgi:secretion/DNA translocation related TadE-like protein
VVAAMMILALVSVTAAGAVLAAAVAARHRAQAAADLAAVSAATWVSSGPEQACAAARAVADAMATRVAACEVDGADVVVRVDAAARLGRWGAGRATAAARAGPATG